MTIYDCDGGYADVYDDLEGPPGLGAFTRTVRITFDRAGGQFDSESYGAAFSEIGRIARVIGGRGYCQDVETIVFTWDERGLVINSSDRVAPVVGGRFVSKFGAVQYQNLGNGGW